MIRKKIFTMFIVFIAPMLFIQDAWAGPLVWGPKKYVRETGKPYVVTDSFTIANPKGKFWRQIGNGGHIKRPDIRPGAVEPVNQVSSAYIKLNGVQVVGPDDLNQNVYGITKDIALQANNTIEVEVRGVPESFITVEIREAELNVGVDNAKGDLSGENMKDQIVLWWSYEPKASEYIIYKGPILLMARGWSGSAVMQASLQTQLISPLKPRQETFVIK
ncbi:MAG: hypothetical protein HZA07_01250 [Nitrospirae bacterium]|nr:hypothetical protein [Nitrospirota bacterium]